MSHLPLMPTLLTDAELKPIPLWDPQRNDPEATKINDMVSNIVAMFDEPARWDRRQDDELVFVHDTGVVAQMTRYPPDDKFKANQISVFVVLWMDGMLPFRIRCEGDIDPGGPRANNAARFVKAYMREETRATIERIAVIAALCKP